MFSPPILEFRSTNWSGVISPEFSAASPYCTPTLSSPSLPNPWWIFLSTGPHSDFGRVPQTFCWKSWTLHRTPLGLVCALYTSLWGRLQFAALLGSSTPANNASHARQLFRSGWPSTAASWAGVHGIEALLK